MPTSAERTAYRQQAMLRAIELAEQNVLSGLGGPFGAVITRDGRLLASGVNQVTSTNDPTAHAEIVAIRLACRAEARFDLRGCELFASCEPCPMCLAAAYWARVDRIWFAASRHDAAQAGFDDSLFYDELARPASARQVPLKTLLVRAGKRPFAAWSRYEKRIPY